MRILLVHSGFEISTSAVGEGLANGLRALGCTVLEYNTYDAVESNKRFLKVQQAFMPDRGFNHENLCELVTAPLLSIVMDYDPVMVIFVHGLYINLPIVRNIKKLGILTHLFLTDEPQQVDTSSRYSQEYDSVSTNDKATIHRHKSGSPNHVTYIPTAFDDTKYKKSKLIEDRETDILIACSLYPERMIFFEKMKHTLLKYKLKIVGKTRLEFEDKRLRKIHDSKRYSLDEFLEMQRNAKLVLDYPRDERYSMLRENGSNLTEEIKATSVSPRVYEVPCCGSILLTGDWRSGLYDIFSRNKVLTFSNNAENCIRKIDEIMLNIGGYQNLVDEQKKIILESHTYKHRASKIMKIISELGTARVPTRALIEVTQGKTELLKENMDSINKNTVNKFDKIWEDNFDKMKNMINKNVDFSKLHKTEDGKACVIVSNGPSLKYTLLKLRKLHSKIDFMSVNGATNILCKNALLPKYTVIIHPTDDQTKHFDEVDNLNHILILASHCSSKVASKWLAKGGKVYYYHAHMPGHEGCASFAAQKKLAIVSANMSVAYSATCCAIALGYKKIIYVGFDFSYVDNEKYYKTPALWEEVIPKGIICKQDTFTKQPVVTDEILLISRNVLFPLIEAFESVEFINASERGIFEHKKLNKMTLDEVLEKQRRETWPLAQVN